ncbi:triacylglycerol lipase [Stagonosporopsis vannaccii]|nr:triacylglycerol lipase [Stagonosporopsis vannaccii]
MIQICARATVRSRTTFTPGTWSSLQLLARRQFASTPRRKEDPRIESMGKEITDEFAVIREQYGTQKYTIVLAHGLLGFSELRLAGQFLPGLKYWRGITEALSAKGIEVIVATVPPSGSVEARAAKLAESIAARAKGKEVNIIAHSMGGLDSRYMISQLKPTDFKVMSLTTIATPHRGSSFADYMFETIGPRRIKRIYNVVEYFGFETGAFSQLTLRYMRESFNPRTTDIEDVKYFSYGASLEPARWSVFAPSHAIVKREEGINDGLVSVSSSQWGNYKGTLMGVSHLDLINWTNRMKWWFWELTGSKRKYDCNSLAMHFLSNNKTVSMPLPCILTYAVSEECDCCTS